MTCALAVPAAAQTETRSGTIKMRLADSRVAFDRPVVAFGRVARGYAGRRVELEFRTGAGAWQAFASSTVRRDGRWRVAGRLARTAVVRATLHPAAGTAAAATGHPRSSERTVAVTAAVGVSKRRFDVKAGRLAYVTGVVLPAVRGRTVALQLRKRGRWVTVDYARTAAGGRYRLSERARRTVDAPARVVAAGRDGHSQARRPVGRLQVYRFAHASWYGPGFYGQRTGCGGRLGFDQLGVAHKSLPCGTRVTFRHRGRQVTVPVIDRGPYVGGREYDLTAATARRLRFSGHGPVLVTR